MGITNEILLVKFFEKIFSCEKHANRFGHQKIADYLEPIIRKEIGWEPVRKQIFPSNPFTRK